MSNRRPLQPDDDSAEQLAEAVEEVVAHGQDDLPPGPSSILGGRVQSNPLTVWRLSEIRRMAGLGMSILDASPSERVKIRNRAR